MVSLCTSGTRFTRKVCLWSSRDIQRTDIEILPGRSARMHCYICNSKLGSPCSERINRHGYSRREGWFKWFRVKAKPCNSLFLKIQCGTKIQPSWAQTYCRSHSSIKHVERKERKGRYECACSEHGQGIGDNITCYIRKDCRFKGAMENVQT